MKKLLLLIAASFSGFGLFAQSAKITLDAPTTRTTCTNSSFKQFDASFSFDEVELTKVETKGGTFTSVSIPGGYPSGRYGTPAVPAVRRLIAVPVGATPIVRVKSFTEQIYSLDQYGSEKLVPNQPSMSKSEDPEKVPFVYDAAAYARKGFEQRELAQVEVLGTMRGVRVAALNINPVEYDAAANVLKVKNNIEIEVSFQDGDEVATQRLYDATYSPYFQSVYSQLMNRDAYTDHPELYNTPVRMLVVAGAKFKEALKPWLTWKAQKGFYVDVFYTDDPAVGTTNNSIKAFIKQKYDEGVAANAAPVFLALVGDTDVISGETGKKTKTVTDLHYCEFTNDYYPEMFSFRMSASTADELTAIIDKAIMVEKYSMTDKSYLENVLLIAGADYNWNPIVGQPTIKYAMQYYFNEAHGYKNVHNYLKAPYTNCYSHLNTGVSFVNYTAHGSETSWVDPLLTTTQLKNLTNKDKYFLAIGNCCLTGKFNYGQPCFGEVITRVKEKGAYAYIGSSPVTYWYEDYYWGVGAGAKVGVQPTFESTTMGAYDATFLEDSYNTVNSILWAGNLAVSQAVVNNNQTAIGSQYYWEAYHVFGDGSVMPNRAMPKDNTATLPASLAMSQASYNITTTAGSYVAISKDGVLYGVGLAGANGVANVKMTKQITTDGNYDVVITRSNYFPIIKQVPAGEPNPNQPVSNLNATVEGNNVKLSWTNPTKATVTIYRNGASIATGVTGSTYTDSNVAAGSYEYCAEVVYSASAVSDKVCVNATIPNGGEFAPVTNLKAEKNGDDVVLKWTAPNGSGPGPDPDPDPTTAFAETFNNVDMGGANYTLELPTGWTSIDADGDGNNWFIFGDNQGHNGGNTATSGSWMVVPLTPDNYLVTPELNLPNGGTLKFWVCAQDGNYPADHYAVYASTSGNAATNFVTALLEETLSSKTAHVPDAPRGSRAQGTWTQKTVQLPAGTKYVAFRHYNCTDAFRINIDDIEITASSKRADLLSEGFESGIPATWKTIDADGDGHDWTTTPEPWGTSLPGHESSATVSS
ncbi:C25 family cysteine peptidase, partial [Porphyromonas loveana]|uniref:C25 family cysteine peptidase n=1 Tax=Porphyromonas loveana TaxID=1884669 RepID=UPI0035A03DD1